MTRVRGDYQMDFEKLSIPLTSHALTLLTELMSSTSNYACITARQVMNFTQQNLESEYLVADSRLSQLI